MWTVMIGLMAYPFQVDGQERRFHGGLKAGISTSQIDGDGMGGYYKFGLLGGGYVNTWFSKQWGMQFEILYIDKGSKSQVNKNTIRLRKFDLAYVEVPLLAQLRHQKFVFEGGFSYGQLVRHRELDENGVLSRFSNFKSYEIAYHLGVNVDLTDRFTSNVRFEYSLIPVRDKVVIDRRVRFGLLGGTFNNALSFSLKYKLTGE